MTKSEKSYRGIVVPMVTPFREDGKIDEISVRKIVQRFVTSGVSVFILGTSGESQSIPTEEKIKLGKLMGKEFAKSLTVFAGISSNCFRTSVELAYQFYDFGIEVFVAHLPSYYPISEQHILEYYLKLVDAIPGKLLLYNIPITTHISIPLEVADELSRHPRIVGIKDSERNPERLEKSLQMWKQRADFSHFLGWASQSVNGLLKGSDGVVPTTGNLVPKMFQQLYEAVLKGDLDQARELQIKTDAISEIYQKDKILSNLIAALKVLMNYFGLCGTNVLPPLLEFPVAEARKMVQQIEKLNLTIE